MAIARSKTTNDAIAEALNNLNSRIEKTETDFVGHLKKVEDRLDQIVELTKTVAVLQQQTSTQSDNITEIRSQTRENAQKTDMSISRIHTRLDEIADHHRNKMELQSKEIEMDIRGVSTKVDNTDKELKAWLNRGWGAWVVFLLVVAGIQTGMYRWVDGIEKEKAASVLAIKELGVFKDRSEIWIKQHEHDFSEIRIQTKKNTESIRDVEEVNSRNMARSRQ